jgi:pyruvate/2-oxoglutarate dehydrogenase complex dihydrolipoamide dehydrogenase (E3) component
LAAGETDGFIKLIAGPRPVLRTLGGGRIVGATIVAARAGEMIHEPALAMATRMFAGRLAAATHAYPTWSYGVQLAAAQFFMTIGGRAAHPARRMP